MSGSRGGRDNQRIGSISSSDKYLNFKGACADTGRWELHPSPAPPPSPTPASPLSQSSHHAAVFRSQQRVAAASTGRSIVP